MSADPAAGLPARGPALLVLEDGYVLRGCGIRAEVGQTGPVVIVTMPVRCLEAVRRTNHILIKQ